MYGAALVWCLYLWLWICRNQKACLAAIERGYHGTLQSNALNVRLPVAVELLLYSADVVERCDTRVTSRPVTNQAHRWSCLASTWPLLTHAGMQHGPSCDIELKRNVARLPMRTTWSQHMSTLSAAQHFDLSCSLKQLSWAVPVLLLGLSFASCSASQETPRHLEPKHVPFSNTRCFWNHRHLHALQVTTSMSMWTVVRCKHRARELPIVRPVVESPGFFRGKSCGELFFVSAFVALVTSLPFTLQQGPPCGTWPCEVQGLSFGWNSPPKASKIPRTEKVLLALKSLASSYEAKARRFMTIWW